MSTPAQTTAAPQAKAAADSPTTLHAAVALLLVQAVAVAGITLFLVYADLTASGADQKLAWAVTGTAFLIAAFLGLLARSVSRHRRWARDLAVALDMIFLAPVYYMFEGGMPWLGVIVGLVTVATIVLLIAPPTNRAVGTAGFAA
ncbi:MAG: hypothetical protein HOV79_23625 [Hamadaea sp.]|nr:hypothetical protein [Hamadaea sp.]